VGDTLYRARVMRGKIWRIYGTVIIAPPHPTQKKPQCPHRGSQWAITRQICERRGLIVFTSIRRNASSFLSQNFVNVSHALLAGTDGRQSELPERMLDAGHGTPR